MEASIELDARIRDMRTHFLVPASTKETFTALDAAAAPLRPEYQAVANAFRHSLASALSTVAMPFALASASAAVSAQASCSPSTRGSRPGLPRCHWRDSGNRNASHRDGGDWPRNGRDG